MSSIVPGTFGLSNGNIVPCHQDPHGAMIAPRDSSRLECVVTRASAKESSDGLAQPGLPALSITGLCTLPLFHTSTVTQLNLCVTKTGIALSSYVTGLVLESV